MAGTIVTATTAQCGTITRRSTVTSAFRGTGSVSDRTNTNPAGFRSTSTPPPKPARFQSLLNDPRRSAGSEAHSGPAPRIVVRCKAAPSGEGG